MRLFSLRPTLVVAVALGMVVPAVAMARTVYECKIEQRGTNRGWVPEIVIVAVDPGSETVLVSDPFIEHVHGGPIEVEPKTNSDQRLSLSWKLTLPATNQNELNITYDFTILKADRRARISGQPHGYDNTFSSQGSCKVMKS